jgi:hypothetical protein
MSLELPEYNNPRNNQWLERALPEGLVVAVKASM